MAQMIVGLDVGANSIKVARVESSLLRFEFVDFEQHFLPTNVDLPWEQLVGNVLRVLFSEPSMRADRIIASIPGRFVSTRLIRLPFTDRKKIDQTLPFEIEGLIPLPLESVLLDYQPLDSGPDGTWILVFFTEKEVLKNHLSLLQDAGVDPNAVIPAPVALGNLWKEISPEERDACAILDMGHSETSLSILNEGILHFGRSWAIGARPLTEALAEGLGISFSLAAEKKEKDASLVTSSDRPHDLDGQKIESILKNALHPIVVGIKQSLMSISDSSGIQVRKLFLCGNGSHLNGLQGYLSDTLRIDVSPLTLHGPVGTLMEEKGVPPAAAATALGLAFHGVREMKTSKVNLRTGEYTYVSERAELKRQLLSGGIMAGILLVMLAVIFGMRYRDRSQEYNRLSSSLETMAVETFPELESIPSGPRRISAMTSRLQQERRESDLFTALSPDSLSVLDILREITEAVPEDVRIDVRELVMEGDKVRIEAETSSYNAAEQIKQNLLASGVFVSADIPEAKDSLDQSKVKFKMNLQLQQKIL